jgi:small conductance mechanosensitive channel
MNEEIAGEVTNRLAEYLHRIFISLSIVLVGILMARLVTMFADRVLKKTKMPGTTRKFVTTLMYIGIIVVTVIMALTPFEIDIGPLVVGLAIIGFIMGLAIQGALSNFAAGIMILAQRPFHVGDFVDVAGEIGIVKEITMTTTVIDTPENVKVSFPNAKVLAGEIKNYSVHKIRMVSVPVEVDANVKIDGFIDSIKADLSVQEKILSDPPFSVNICGLSSSKVSLIVKVWCNADETEEVSNNIFHSIREKLEKN